MAEDCSPDPKAVPNNSQPRTTDQDDTPDEAMLTGSSSDAPEKYTITKKCLHACKDIPWFTLAVLTITNIVLGNIYYAFSIFYIEFVETFNVTYSSASWVGSIQLCVSFVSGKEFTGQKKF